MDSSARVTDLALLAPRLRAGLEQLGLEPEPLAERLLAYLALLLQWNRAYNLTAVRDPAEMISKHLLDSLSIHPYVAGSLADIGTGPGLPGVPLALAKPGLRVSLVETAGKKARFLREAVRRLGLPQVAVHDARAQDVPETGRHDCLAARAFGTLGEILAAGGHLLASGGRLLAMKGREPTEEFAALPAGYRHLATHPLSVPGLDAERHLVVVEKL
jgi:16S rRNA (guanine527-N7)-methyltransferase